MKKIFTLLLAVALTSVVCAQSIKKQHNPFADKKANTTMMKPELNRGPISNFKGMKHHATKDAAVVDNLLAVSYSSYTGTTGDYGMQFQLDTNLVFYAEVLTSANDRIAGSYTITDAIWVDGTDTIAVEGTFSLTYVSDNGDGTYIYTATASLTEQNGTATYGFTNEQIEVTAIDYLYYVYYMYGMVQDFSMVLVTLHDSPLPNDFDTVNVNFIPSETSLTDLTASQGVFQFVGIGSAYLCSFAVYSNTIAGVYDSADIMYNYALILDAATETSLGTVYNARGSVVATDGGYDVTAQYFTYEGTMYNITMSYLIPVAEDTVVMPSLSHVELVDYSAYDGSYQVRAYDDAEENHVLLNYFSATIDGTFTFEDCDNQYSGLGYNGEQKTIYSANFTVAAVDGGYHYAGSALCTDNTVYQFAFDYMFPVAEDTVDLSFTNAVLEDYSQYDGSYQFVAANADSTTFVAVCYFPASDPTGSFTTEDLDAGYTAIYVDNVEMELYTCNFTVSSTTDGYMLDGYFLCKNNICYHVTISTSNNTQSISNVEVSQVRVYPNPFSSKLNVEAEGVQEIQVIDMMGQIVVRQANAGAIDMSALANGAYMVRIVTENGISTQKVIKK